MSQSLLHLSRSARAATRTGPIVRFGLVSLGIALLAFVVWATVVPIASSVSTPGTLVSDGRNKLVQHPTGGRVTAIRARNGDRVEKGQALVELDVSRARAELTRLTARARSLRATRARLTREIGTTLRGNRTVETPKHWTLRLRGGSDVAMGPVEMIDETLTTASATPPGEVERSEGDVYTFGRAALAQELAVLDARIATLRRQRRGLQARSDSTREMLGLTLRERDRLRPLVERGYVARNRLRERERSVVEMRGKLVTQDEEVAAIDTRIAEIEHERGRVRADDMKSSSADLSRIATELAELSDQIVAARAGVEQAVLRAPVSGTIVRMEASTRGGVVGAGDVVAEIVPDAAAIVVAARVSPSDIAHVRVGGAARIVVTAFAWRGDEAIPAIVKSVDADSERDERTGETFFTVHVAPDPEATRGRMTRLAELHTGMTAEVMLSTGERTFAAYLFEPLLRSFRRTFRES